MSGEEVGAAFIDFFAAVEPRLRRALMAAYGPELGRDATAEALAWAWEHRDRLSGLDAPVAYLFRVGQSRARRRKVRIPFVRGEWSEPRVEPQLGAALRRLPERQRVAVVLLHGYGWTMAEVAELFGVKVTTVQTHLDRGLARLRSILEVDGDA
jgi:DNA-directed RNA polymerase specialized sigma24 family protein